MVLAQIALARETIVVGDVLSAETGEPIANASVYYPGTRLGTTSDAEGSFVLRTDMDKRHTLVVSAVGYRTERFTIEAGAMAGMQVLLREQTALLSEIVAVPGVNPALALLDEVRAHRAENDIRLSGGGQPEKRTTELYLSGIERRHLQRRLWHSLETGMIAGEDSTMLLPLYSSEKGAVVMAETDYEALITEDGNLNFYETSISLMSRSFISPLARSGGLYYNYYLADSIDSPEGKQYIVHFRTKNPYYETLNGELTIDSATYAIAALTAEIPEQTSVNYLRGAKIYQRFNPDHSLADEDIRIVLDFAVKIDHSKMFPTVLIRHSLRGSSTADVADRGAKEEEGSEERDSWTDSFAALDSVPIVRFARWTASIINTGYIPTGTYVDIGHIQEILQVNRTEGVHVGLPFRTSEKLMKNVALEAAIGYGFRNQRLTGLGRIWAQLPAKRRHLLVAEYQDHLVWPEVSEMSRFCYENGMGRHTMDFTSYAFEALYSNDSARNTMVRQRQFELRTENDWTDQVETQLYLKVGNMGFNYQTIGGVIRLGWGERKVDMFMRRVHIGGPYPTLFLQAEMGSWSLDSDYRLYGRLGLMMKQQVSLGIAGRLDYALSGGYVIGQVPDLLLHHFEGNQTYAYDPYRFTLMNNGRYSSRAYVSLHTMWNGQGILFNIIPGIRYLRLRELVTFKLGWGDGMKTPYVELGCGIGNILRVMEVHSVWRLTNRRDLSAPLWAMRFRFNIEL